MILARNWGRNRAAVIATLFVAVVSLHLALESLQPVAERIEAELLAIAQGGTAPFSAPAAFAHDLWLASKALVFPGAVIALTFFAEAKLSQAEREPKDYLTATLVQITFFYLAYVSAMWISRLIPLSEEPLISAPEGLGAVVSTLLTLAVVGIFLVAYDFLLYWTHRAHHHIPLLWRFHAIHHSPNDLDALHNYVHPVEQLIRYFTIALPLNFLVQIDQADFYLIFTFLALQNQLTHMNAPLHFGPFGQVLVDNRHHFIHHSSDPAHYDRNYAAIFSFTDRLFGTFHPAAKKSLPKTGFAPAERPERLVDFVLARRARAGRARTSLPSG